MASAANPFDVLSGLGAAPTAKNGMMFQNPLSVVDRITSNFGPRSSPNVGGGRRGSSNHKGTDLAEAGQAGYAVEAAGAGTVTFAGNKGGYGLTIEVTHPNGYKTQYSHLESLNAKVGDEIAAGTPVGKVGNTGKSSGPHLHFEVKDPTGKAVNPKSVTDLATNRSLSVTPSPRPSDDLGALMSFAPTTSPSMPSMPDVSRFGPEVSRAPSMQSSPMGMVSSPVSPAGGYARAEAPAGFSREPSPDRFGPAVADIDRSRFGYTPEPSMSRFGYDMAQNVASPVSPAGGYAVASAPSAAPAPTGGLGGLGGMVSTPKADRLSSPMSVAASTPMASTPSQAMRSPLSMEIAAAGFPSQNVTTKSVTTAPMGFMPSTVNAPAGPASRFNNVPVDMVAASKNAMKAPPLSINLPSIPTMSPMARPAVTPMITPVAPVATPAMARQAVSPVTTGAVRNAPPTPPRATAADVYAGRATQGLASNGMTVTRDQFGNTSVTNQYGVTTTTDPSGRQMGNLGGLGKGIGAMMDKVSPGMVGSVIGGAIAGMPGSVIGGMIGSKMGGQQSTSGQKSGGLGGLGGFLAGIFGGGSSSSSSGGKGGGSSGSGSRGGGGSSGGRASPGADRSQAGNN